MKYLNELGIGSFRPGTTANGRHLAPTGHGSPRSDADSHHSRLSQRHYPDDYFEEFDEDEDIILECRVYRNGKFQLLETLEALHEFPNYADKYAQMAQKINDKVFARNNKTRNLDSLQDKINQNENLDELDEEPIEEFSGAAAGGGGPAVPLGYTAKGKPETRAQRRKRQQFNITKSYPYTKLANPPRSRKKRRKK